MTGETPTDRRAARVHLLDEDRRVLLVRFAYRGERWWAAPGGGLEEDETHEDAARREVAEETGFELDDLGPWVWTREHVFRFEGRLYRQQERYFVANVPTFVPRPQVIDAEEAKAFDGLRWWTLGPVLGSLVAGRAGYRVAFALTAALFLSALIPLAGLRVRRTRRGREDRHGKEPARPWEMPGVRLAVFGLVCLLVLSGEAVRLAYLPIFATDRLGMGLGQFGALMAVAPLTELAAMPLAGVLADRVGLSKVLVAGFALGARGYLLFGGGGSVWSLHLGQVLQACMIAVVFGLGVTYAQRLSPGSAGLAGSVFFSAQSLSALTGSLLGSGGVWLVGLPGMFFLPAAVLAAACALFVWNDRARRKGVA